MKLNAVGVISTNFKKTIEFYSILGFKFPEFKDDEQHVEALVQPGETRLMIDSATLIKEIFGEDHKPANVSQFAIQYDSVDELNGIAKKVESAGFKIIKQPWDAFWGQRYAILEDPDGFRLDLYCNL